MTCVLIGSSAQMSLGGPGCRLQTCSRLASEWSDSTFRAFCNRQYCLIAQTETVGNFLRLYKSKMNVGRHVDNFTFEPLVLECSVIPLFGSSKVHVIHLLCNFFQIM